MKLTVEEIAGAVNGSVPFSDILNTVVTSVSTDSRNIQPGSLFIALRGDNFDGHDHVGSAFDKGAVCALIEKDIPPQAVPYCLIRVDSTHQALLDLAANHRRIHHNIKIAAITGSVGKTTTKDMIASVLSQRYKTLKTPGNKNNLIGLPLTLLSLDESHEAAVLEMGMNHFGEIHELSLTAAPDICVITNIGDAHIAYLESREGILKAKLEIIDGLKPGGVLVLNGSDPLLAGLQQEPLRTVFCSVDVNANHVKQSPTNGIYATEITSLGLTGMKCSMHIENKSCDVFIPSPGVHMVINALLAASVGNILGLTTDEIVKGIAAFIPTDSRMAVHEGNEMRVIDDAYNANPASMRAAINVLAGIEDVKRRVCILGDMLELGEHAERLHREIGEYINESGIDLIIAIGENARYYITEMSRYNNKCHSFWFKDNKTFLMEWKDILHPGDAVLVKASQGMRFSEIIQGVLA